MKIDWGSLDPRIKLGVAFLGIGVAIGIMVVLLPPALILREFEKAKQ